ncbi:MAG: hypothetical protein HXS52_10655 [Theionarchaea archaeon]|nr:hypothetical protein [Theionarchaea archaeon]MBU7038381.1 hypothetical protein [Theionarchaea archaeon]
MKAVALVVCAREHGNCLDFADYILNRLRAAEITWFSRGFCIYCDLLNSALLTLV